MFGKKSLSLYRVYDTVKVREGGETLTLHVNSDPARIIAGLNQAQKMLKSIDKDTSAEEKTEIAMFFAGVIFGDNQAQALLDFYYGDSLCVISICSKYFADRLGKKISAAQKKAK